MSVDANENVTIIKSLENCQIDVGIKKKRNGDCNVSFMDNDDSESVPATF